MSLLKNPAGEVSSLRGIVLEKESSIEQRLLELNSWSNNAASYKSWAFVLGGDSPIHMGVGNHLTFEDGPIRDQDGALYGRTTSMQLKLWLGTKWQTGVDLDKLADTAPDERWKYYLSLDLTDPSKQAISQDFFRKLLEKCTERGVALMTKTQDHLYDSLLLYTWHTEGMDSILSELSPQYNEMWKSVRRVFQKPINGVNPMHIGRVQEPFGGRNGSHSGRMHSMGKYFDTNLPSKWTIDRDNYVRACKFAEVKADTPWEVT